MPEPSAILLRLTELERRIAELENKERKTAAQAWNARHQGQFNEAFVDEVVMPLLLLIGGQAHKANLLNALQSLIERIADHPGIPGQVASYYDADVRGWQNAVLAIPEWQPLDHGERYPGDPGEE